MTTHRPFTAQHTFARALPELVEASRAKAFAAPDVLAWDQDLARELFADELSPGPETAALLTGAVCKTHETYAMAYAGHQFGNFSPRLGDGRALLLGEIAQADGSLVDVHLKGTGPTTFSRGGDGFAALADMLREYVMSAFMHAIGIPTTRSLAVCTTGEQVQRDGSQPGAVLARVAASHIRVGTFEYAAAHLGPVATRSLLEYSLERHGREPGSPENPAAALLYSVTKRQARLVGAHMAAGFVHGVMNTDNMTISGETIDYGPCAMVQQFSFGAVFSSIDTGGRYAFGNQPAAAAWNLARLAEALLPVWGTPEDDALAQAKDTIESFAAACDAAYMAAMGRKLALATPDRDLTVGLLTLLDTTGADYPSFFIALAEQTAAELFTGEHAARFAAWHESWSAAASGSPEDRYEALLAANPRYVPRHGVVADVLQSTSVESRGSFDELCAIVRAPFSQHDGELAMRLANPTPGERVVTYCGT